MTTSRSSAYRGFSLIEAMFAMGLVFSLLGLTALLMREFSSASRHTDARDNSLDGVQFALAEMAHEIGCAIAVTETGTTLGFQKIDPAVTRFPPPPPAGEPYGWAVRDPGHFMTVRYFKEAGTGALVRQTSGPSGATRQVMVKTVAGMRADRQGASDFYLLSLSFQEDRLLRSFSLQARTWVAP